MQTQLLDSLISISEFSTDVVPKPNNWAVLIICFLLLLLTLLIVPFRKKLNLIFKSLFSQRHYSLLLREGKILEERVFAFTLIFDLMTFSLGLDVIAEKFMPQVVKHLSYIGLFGIFFASLLLIYFFKFFVNYIYTALFEHKKERYLMNLDKFSFLTVAAVILFPFLVVVQFTGRFAILYAYIPVFFALLACLLYNLMKINPKAINLFQFFIYFCTLEILPYVILVKFIAII
ncbi:MAG: DUF4271 domain-containing protein [Bacteroidales bacterium]|nr:DUF4271 domain-containing protein [Bacteroidales bacterium]